MPGPIASNLLFFEHESGGYVAARKQAGWIKSRVLDHSFRLTRRLDDAGNPDYTLSVRSGRASADRPTR